MSVVSAIVTANAGLFLMGRVYGANGQAVTRASLTSISWQATDLLAGAVAGSGTFAIADVVFDQLQTQDARWTADGTGYNFGASLPAGTFPATTPGGPALTPASARLYQIDVKFTAADGTVSYAVFRVQAIPVYF